MAMFSIYIEDDHIHFNFHYSQSGAIRQLPPTNPTAKEDTIF